MTRKPRGKRASSKAFMRPSDVRTADTDTIRLKPNRSTASTPDKSPTNVSSSKEKCNSEPKYAATTTRDSCAQTDSFLLSIPKAIARTRHEYPKSRFEQQIATLQKENELLLQRKAVYKNAHLNDQQRLKEANTWRQGMIQDLQGAHNQNARLRDEKTKLKHQAEGLQLQTGEKEAELKTMQERNDQMARHLADFKQQMEDFQREADGRQAELKTLQGQNDQSAKDIADVKQQMEKDKAQYEQEQENLMNQRRSLEEFEKEASKNLKSLQAQNKELARANERGREEYGALKKKHDLLDANLQSVVKERDELAQNKQTLSGQLMTLANAYRALQAERDSLSAEQTQLKDSKWTLEASLDAKQKELDRRKDDIKHWMARRDEIVRKLEAQLQDLRKKQSPKKTDQLQNNYVVQLLRGQRDEALMRLRRSMDHATFYLQSVWAEHVRASATREEDEYYWANIHSLASGSSQAKSTMELQSNLTAEVKELKAALESAERDYHTLQSEKQYLEGMLAEVARCRPNSGRSNTSVPVPPYEAVLERIALTNEKQILSMQVANLQREVNALKKPQRPPYAIRISTEQTIHDGEIAGIYRNDPENRVEIRRDGKIVLRPFLVPENRFDDTAEVISDGPLVESPSTMEGVMLREKPWSLTAIGYNAKELKDFEELRVKNYDLLQLPVQYEEVEEVSKDESEKMDATAKESVESTINEVYAPKFAELRNIDIDCDTQNQLDQSADAILQPSSSHQQRPRKDSVIATPASPPPEQRKAAKRPAPQTEDDARPFKRFAVFSDPVRSAPKQPRNFDSKVENEQDRHYSPEQDERIRAGEGRRRGMDHWEPPGVGRSASSSRRRWRDRKR